MMMIDGPCASALSSTKTFHFSSHLSSCFIKHQLSGRIYGQEDECSEMPSSSELFAQYSRVFGNFTIHVHIDAPVYG